MTRRGNWISTSSGKTYWPIDPRPEEVSIEDIAASLSKICRYNGHCRKFYSVAEHAVHVSVWLEKQGYDAKVQFQGLHHDDTEAYCMDVPRPLKPLLKGYAKIEHINAKAIAKHLNLDLIFDPAVKRADDAVLMAEKPAVMPQVNACWGVSEPPAQVRIRCFSPEAARKLYLNRHNLLLRRIGKTVDK